MKEAANPQQEGVRIAQEILGELRPILHGVYHDSRLWPLDLVADVLDSLHLTDD